MLICFAGDDEVAHQRLHPLHSLGHAAVAGVGQQQDLRVQVADVQVLGRRGAARRARRRPTASSSAAERERGEELPAISRTDMVLLSF
ncbi:hypothetical protein ALISP_2644 [Alicycliphilus sp. B1]|nr:hypothetical protein ALISP_2644 [Alicycliphilus sp. B1]